VEVLFEDMGRKGFGCFCITANACCTASWHTSALAYTFNTPVITTIKEKKQASHLEQTQHSLSKNSKL
jgi:hypothetical protein